jgi:hypothetical protein
MGEFIGEVRASILELLAESSLSPAQKIVYLAIRQWVQIQSYGMPTVSEVVEMTGLSESGVKQILSTLRKTQGGFWLDGRWICEKKVGRKEDTYWGRYRVEQLREVARLILEHRIRKDKRARKRRKYPFAAVIMLVHILTFEKARTFKRDGKDVSIRCFAPSDRHALAKQALKSTDQGKNYVRDLLQELMDIGVLRRLEGSRCYTVNLPGSKVVDPRPTEAYIIPREEPVESPPEQPAPEPEKERVAVVEPGPFTFETVRERFLVGSHLTDAMRNENILGLREEFTKIRRLEDARKYVGPLQSPLFQELADRDVSKLLDHYLTDEEAAQGLGRPLTSDEKQFFWKDRPELLRKLIPPLPGLVHGLRKPKKWTRPDIILPMSEKQELHWRDSLIGMWQYIYKTEFKPGKEATADNLGKRHAREIVRKMNDSGWELSALDEKSMKRSKKRIWVFLSLACESMKSAKKKVYTPSSLSGKFEELKGLAEEDEHFDGED